MRKPSRAAAGDVKLTLLTGGVAAACASVVLLVLFGIYILPFGTSPFGSQVPAEMPAITAGEEYFDRPETIIVTLRADKVVYVGANAVRRTDLESHLRTMHLKYPERMVELRAFKRATLGDLAPVLGAMRGSGYSRFWVFGRPSAVLELASRTST